MMYGDCCGAGVEVLTFNEPPHDNTNKMTFVPSEDSDQSGYLLGLIRVFVSTWRNIGSSDTHWAHSEDSDQTGGIPRLIWVFAGHTDHFVVLSGGGSLGLSPTVSPCLDYKRVWESYWLLPFHRIFSAFASPTWWGKGVKLSWWVVTHSLQNGLPRMQWNNLERP